MIVPATVVTTVKLMRQWRQATKLLMTKKVLTIFSILIVSILTSVSLPLFDVLRLVAVGIVDFEGNMDLDSPDVCA